MSFDKACGLESKGVTCTQQFGGWGLVWKHLSFCLFGWLEACRCCTCTNGSMNKVGRILGFIFWIWVSSAGAFIIAWLDFCFGLFVLFVVCFKFICNWNREVKSCSYPKFKIPFLYTLPSFFPSFIFLLLFFSWCA